MTVSAATTAAAGPLSNRSFRIYLLGNTVSGLGTWAQRIGIGWLSWDLTHRTYWVGAVSLAQVLPLTLAAPFFGVLLDRHDYRRYALTVNTILALLASILYALTALHAMTIGLLCAMAVLLGFANGAYQSVRLNMVNNLVTSEQLSSAIAWTSLMFNVSRALGPAMAGVLISKLGIAIAFAANALSFLAMLAALALVDFRQRPIRQIQQGIAAEALEGLRYMLGDANLRRLLLLSAITSIAGRGIMELMPAFADAVFHQGSAGLARLTTAAGLGAIVGATLFARAGTIRRAGQLTQAVTVVLGVVIAIFGFAHTNWSGLLGAAALGFAVIACSIGLQIKVQTGVADKFRGRVMGVWSAVSVSGPGLGAAVAGVVAHWLGLRITTLATGILCAALVMWVSLSTTEETR